MKTYIGIDNGVSGSIGIINETYFEDKTILTSNYIKTPVKKEFSYTKKVQRITRIDGNYLFEIFEPFLNSQVQVMIERPLVNPRFFKATLSALRSLEATLIVLEKCKFPYKYLDSTEWQNVLLPEEYEGKKVEGDMLKISSLGIAKELFPNLDYTKFTDGDGILIAEYCRRKSNEKAVG